MFGGEGGLGAGRYPTLVSVAVKAGEVKVLVDGVLNSEERKSVTLLLGLRGGGEVMVNVLLPRLCLCNAFRESGFDSTTRWGLELVRESKTGGSRKPAVADCEGSDFRNGLRERASVLPWLSGGKEDSNDGTMFRRFLSTLSSGVESDRSSGIFEEDATDGGGILL